MQTFKIMYPLKIKHDNDYWSKNKCKTKPSKFCSWLFIYANLMTAAVPYAESTIKPSLNKKDKN